MSHQFRIRCCVLFVASQQPWFLKWPTLLLSQYETRSKKVVANRIRGGGSKWPDEHFHFGLMIWTKVVEALMSGRVSLYVPVRNHHARACNQELFVLQLTCQWVATVRWYPSLLCGQYSVNRYLAYVRCWMYLSTRNKTNGIDQIFSFQESILCQS